MTGVALAKELGVSQSFVSEVERGKSGPSVAMLMKLAHLYDLDPVWLLAGSGGPLRRKRPAPLAEPMSEQRLGVEVATVARVLRQQPLLMELLELDPDRQLSPDSREIIQAVRHICRSGSPAMFAQLKGFVGYLIAEHGDIEETG